MGRPLQKDINGTDVIGSYSATTGENIQSGIVVEFHDGTALRSDGCIVKQRGARTYVVTRVGNISTTAALNASASQVVCVLQSGTPSAVGQMRIKGVTSAPADVYLAKLTKRIATDFDGKRYTWKLTKFQDLSTDEISLTLIS